MINSVDKLIGHFGDWVGLINRKYSQVGIWETHHWTEATVGKTAITLFSPVSEVISYLPGDWIMSLSVSPPS